VRSVNVSKLASGCHTKKKCQGTWYGLLPCLVLSLTRLIYNNTNRVFDVIFALYKAKKRAGQKAHKKTKHVNQPGHTHSPSVLSSLEHLHDWSR